MPRSCFPLDEQQEKTLRDLLRSLDGCDQTTSGKILTERVFEECSTPAKKRSEPGGRMDFQLTAENKNRRGHGSESAMNWAWRLARSTESSSSRNGLN